MPTSFNPPISCINTLLEIQGNDCIGDTRVAINDNVRYLGTAICNLSSQRLVPSTSTTIQHSLNNSSRVLTFEIRDNSVTTSKIASSAVTTDKIAPEAVRYSQLASWQTLSASPTLSAEAVQPRLAKAWVIFNGQFGSSPYTIANGGIESSFNVTSITDNGVADYYINFAPGAMKSNKYTISGYATDNTQNYYPGILYIGPSNVRTTTQCQIYTTGAVDATGYDSPRVMVIFFGGD